MKFVFYKTREEAVAFLKDRVTRLKEKMQELKDTYNLLFEVADPKLGPYRPTALPEGITVSKEGFIIDKGKGKEILAAWRKEIEPLFVTDQNVWDLLSCHFAPRIVQQGGFNKMVQGPEDVVMLQDHLYVMTTDSSVMSTKNFEEVDANSFFAAKSELITHIEGAGKGGVPDAVIN